MNGTTGNKLRRFFGESRGKLVIALVAALVVAGVGYFLMQTQAAGFFASVNPSQGTVSGNAKLVADNSASGGTAVQFTAPATPPPSGGGTPPTPPPPSTPTSRSCPLPKYPSDACTGVPPGTVLETVSGDMTVTSEGAVVQNKKITGNLFIRANNVTVRNSEIAGFVENDLGARQKFTIEDSTLGPASGCGSISDGMVKYSNYTAKRLRIRNQPDGFRVAGSNVLIEDSYVTVCSKNSNDHSDGIQVYGASNGTNIVMRHNTIDQRSVTNGAATSPIFVPNDGANQGNQNVSVTVTDNVLAGGGYSLRIFGNLPFSAPAVTGNKIVNGTWAYQPVDITCGKVGTWQNNAVITYDWTAGTILSQVRPLDTC